MATEGKIIAGLDIGTTKICVVVGKENRYGKLEVMGMGRSPSYGVISGIVTNIDKTVHSIKQALEEAARASGTNIGIVNVGIAGQHIRSSVHRGSTIRTSKEEVITVEDTDRLTQDMYKIVVPPGCDIIHVMPQDYMVDYQSAIKDPIGMTGSRLEADFNIITAQTSAITHINKCIRLAGLEVDHLILEPLASSLSALGEEEKEAGVCLVDIGGGTTDLAIFYDSIIRHTAVIPFGGNIVTSDIKQGCTLLEAQAEQLKLRFGSAVADEASPLEVVSIPGLRHRPPKEISIRKLAHIIQARMEEIIEMVHAEIISSGYQDKLSAGIVITGGGGLLKDIQQLFSYMTGYDTRLGYPNEYLGRSKTEEAKSPMYATSIGLVLSGFKAIDERENRFITKKVSSHKKSKKEYNFFRNIINKTKDILLDDLDQKMT